MSPYLHEPGHRNQLLDYLASLYESIADLSGCLLDIEQGGLDHDAFRAAIHSATTHAMDIHADWKMVGPMLLSIYREDEANEIPVTNG